jgi:hypothetical protein
MDHPHVNIYYAYILKRFFGGPLVFLGLDWDALERVGPLFS